MFFASYPGTDPEIRCRERVAVSKGNGGVHEMSGTHHRIETSDFWQHCAPHTKFSVTTNPGVDAHGFC